MIEKKLEKKHIDTNIHISEWASEKATQLHLINWGITLLKRKG